MSIDRDLLKFIEDANLYVKSGIGRNVKRGLESGTFSFEEEEEYLNKLLDVAKNDNLVSKESFVLKDGECLNWFIPNGDIKELTTMQKLQFDEDSYREDEKGSSRTLLHRLGLVTASVLALGALSIGGYFGAKSVREQGSQAFATKQKSSEETNKNKEGTSKFNKKLTSVLNNLANGVSEEDVKSLESLAKTDEDKSLVNSLKEYLPLIQELNNFITQDIFNSYLESRKNEFLDKNSLNKLGNVEYSIYALLFRAEVIGRSSSLIRESIVNQVLSEETLNHFKEFVKELPEGERKSNLTDELNNASLLY